MFAGYSERRKEDHLTTTHHYQLRLEGLAEARGQIKAQPRFIEARKINPPAVGDEIFASLPMVPASLSQDSLFPELTQRSRDADPMSLWGAWPGDEAIEEFMAQLD